MAHVQRAGHIGWRQLDGEAGAPACGAVGATEARHAIKPRFSPFGAPMGFQGGRFKRFGQGLIQAAAFGAPCVHGVGAGYSGPIRRFLRRPTLCSIHRPDISIRRLTG